MRNYLKNILHTPTYVTTFVIASLATSAHSAAKSSDIGGVALTVTNQLENIGRLIGGAAFVGGVFFVATGLFKLKAAVDTQGQQTKYGEGVWRLALGAALVSLPAVIGIGTGTFGLGGFGANSAETINFGTTFGN